jgi:predicted nucleic acid-binding protein
MKRILLDTNIVLDALLTRTPWNVDAEAIFKANLGGQVAAHITANSLTDIFYVAR